MRFIVDAQLPKRLAQALVALGADAIHTLDLPARNATSDQDVIAWADREKRIVVSKDSDFVDSFLLKGQPAKLLFVTTGNIPNDDLLQLLHMNWTVIQGMFAQGDFVELSRTSVTLHC